MQNMSSIMNVWTLLTIFVISLDNMYHRFDLFCCCFEFSQYVFINSIGIILRIITQGRSKMNDLSTKPTKEISIVATQYHEKHE